MKKYFDFPSMTIFRLLLREFATQTWFSKCQQCLCLFHIVFECIPLRVRPPTSERCSDFEHGTSKSDFEVQCSMFEHRTSKSFDLLGQASEFEVGVGTSTFDFLGQTWNFEVRLCSMSPPSPAPLSCLNLFFFVFFLFFFFFSTPSFKARLQSFNFELRTSILEF